MLAFGNPILRVWGDGRVPLLLLVVSVVVVGRWVDEIMEDLVGLGLVWFVGCLAGGLGVGCGFAAKSRDVDGRLG